MKFINVESSNIYYININKGLHTDFKGVMYRLILWNFKKNENLNDL